MLTADVICICGHFFSGWTSVKPAGHFSYSFTSFTVMIVTSEFLFAKSLQSEFWSARIRNDLFGGSLDTGLAW